jgi:hypothetical protein
MNRLITARYWGGLGNVLFEIAAAIVYAEQLNRRFVFEHYPALPNLDNYSPLSAGMTDKEFADSLIEFSEEEIERNVPFPENRNIKLTGFYQKYKLFEPMQDHVFDVMGIPAIRSSVLAKITGTEFRERGLYGRHTQESNATTISLHIRRGDYEGLQCYFLLLNQYYYKTAILRMIEKLEPGSPIKILCFYETKSALSSMKVIDALKQDTDLNQYSLEYHHFNDIINGTVTDVEEMAIMSQCDHHVIANSTYSWWAAYINPFATKMVSYPDEYFNHQLFYLSNKGLQVDGWMSIPAWNPNEYRCGCYRR